MWFVDRSYLLPTIVSLSTFTRLPGTSRYIYASADITPAMLTDLERAAPDARVRRLAHCAPSAFGTDRVHVAHRLARIAAIDELSEEILLLVDSDTAFTAGGSGHLVSHVTGVAASVPGAVACGVPEFTRASDSWYYFHRRQPAGGYLNSARSERVRALADIFGPDWARRLRLPAPNNGVLAIIRGRFIGPSWRNLYLSGLRQQHVNPRDDQVPLAAALADVGAALISMPVVFNSLGAVDGDYAVFHALASAWRPEVSRALIGASPRSDYGRLCAEALRELDRNGDTAHTLDGPFLFASTRGDFGHHALYRAALTHARGGLVVEVWPDSPMSTCYLAELSRGASPQPKCVTLTTSSESHAELSEALRARSLHSYADVRLASSADTLQSCSVDALLFPQQIPLQTLPQAVTAWLPALRQGGILACHLPVYPVGPEAHLSFAESAGLRISGCTTIVNSEYCLILKA